MILIYSTEDELSINDFIADELNKQGNAEFKAIKSSDEPGWMKEGSTTLLLKNVPFNSIIDHTGDSQFKCKPVSAEIISLPASINRLDEKFQILPFFLAKTAAMTNRDRRLLSKIIEIIQQRITDPQFSVEELSKDLAMSRSNLHKKLKSISGYVPNEFIRLIRLKMAVRLILSQEFTISEISYLVGFNSHSYFSKCFINLFKISPSEFLEKNNNS